MTRGNALEQDSFETGRVAGLDGPFAPGMPEPPRRRGWVLFLLAVLLAAGGYAYWRRASRPGTKAPEVVVRTATARISDLERAIRVTGSISAERYAVLTAPRLPGARGVSGHGDFRLILQKLVSSGTRVKKGDVVAAFDPQYMLNRLDDYRASFLQHEKNVEKLRAELDVKRKAYEQRIRTAKGKMDQAALDLKTSSIRSAIQKEQFRLNLEEARARYKQLLSDLKYVEISERSAILRSELDMRVSEIEMRRAEANVGRMAVRAPIDGLAVVQTIHRAGEQSEIQPGDQLYPGHVFMQLVDTGSMVMVAGANQVDAEELRLNLRARVRLDTYPEIELPARVVSVGTLAKGGGARASFVKRIPVRLKLERTDARVLPNFSGSADLILERVKHVVVIPREAVFRDSRGEPFAFVRRASGWEKRPIELGLANHIGVAVRAGLRAGEVVALEPPPAP